jgi:hypothetical protein
MCGQVLKRIVESEAAPGTEIFVQRLSPPQTIVEQYRYFESWTPPGVMVSRSWACGNLPFMRLPDGETFLLINVDPRFTHRILKSVKLQGLAGRLVSVDQMKVERPGAFDLAARDPGAIAEVIEEFAERAWRSIEKC